MWVLYRLINIDKWLQSSISTYVSAIVSVFASIPSPTTFQSDLSMWGYVPFVNCTSQWTYSCLWSKVGIYQPALIKLSICISVYSFMFRSTTKLYFIIFLYFLYNATHWRGSYENYLEELLNNNWIYFE